MREHEPAYWDAQNEVWAFTRYEDIFQIEKDAKTYSSHRAPRPHGDHLPMMISMDAPEHNHRRKLVSRGFTPRRVRDHEPTIRRICTEIIDRVAMKGECDFVWDIAAPLPLLLIADMLGFPPDAYDDLLRWSDDLIRGTTIGDPVAQEAAMMAGIDPGVEELLRWVSPIKNMARTVTRDVELHGETLREGNQVILMYPAANRDRAVFDDADRFDVRRDPNPHLAFGFGPHFCMGAS